MSEDLYARRMRLLQDMLHRPWPADRFGRLSDNALDMIDRKLIIVGMRVARDERGCPIFCEGNLQVEEAPLEMWPVGLAEAVKLEPKP